MVSHFGSFSSVLSKYKQFVICIFLLRKYETSGSHIVHFGGTKGATKI